mgnify:CR=1 FL=1
MEKELVGFTAGNFDLLHPGYIYTFEEAKRHCDRFLVFLQKDPSATRYTKYKPVIPYYERYKTLMAIQYVDDVYMYQTEEELIELIKFFKPDIRILGEWSTTRIKDLITRQTIKQNPNIIDCEK